MTLQGASCSLCVGEQDLAGGQGRHPFTFREGSPMLSPTACLPARTPHVLDLTSFCRVCTSFTWMIKLHILLHGLETCPSVNVRTGQALLSPAPLCWLCPNKPGSPLAFRGCSLQRFTGLKERRGCSCLPVCTCLYL